MGRIIHSPRLTALTIALAATAPTAQAVPVSCPAVNGNTSGQVTWTTGDCAVAASVVVPGTIGLVASGTLGTLTNTGTISGVHYGMSNSGSITLLNNTIGGTISASGGSSAGLVNTGTIGTLTNSGTITSNFSRNGNAIYNNGGTITALTNTGVINSVNSGIFNGGGTIGTLTNTNIIAGNRWGITNGASIIVLNNNGGIISGNTSGISNASVGTIGTLTNSGTISSNTYGINNSGSIGSAGTINTLTNSGRINGTADGILNSGVFARLNNAVGGTIVGNVGVTNVGSNMSTRTVTTTSSSNVNSASTSAGAIGTLTNSGMISGTASGISNNGVITLLNNTLGGTISGSIGVSNTGASVRTSTIISGTSTRISNTSTGTGTIGTLTNSGMISGTVSAISNSGVITLLNNTVGGTISGNTGISNPGAGTSITGSTTSITAAGTIGTLTNSGTITGSLYAIDNGGSLGTITNSGVIAGNIRNTSLHDLNINGGTGSTFGTLTGFAGGTIGTITNTNSNVNFGSGNLLLNDTVNLGNNTLNNTAATLQVNNAITVNGNYNQGAAATLQIGVANNAMPNGSLTGDSGYGRLVVTGSAIIAAGSSISLKPLTAYNFAVGQRFVVVDASSNGTNYNQTNLNYSAANFAGTLSGTNVATDGRSDLVVTLAAGAPASSTTPPTTQSNPPTPLPSPATVPNAVSALSGLLSYSGISPGLLNLFNAADALAAGSSTAAVNRAGVQLAPVQQATSTGAAAAPTLDVLNVVAAHADSLRLAQADGIGSGVSTGEGAPAWSTWGQAFGGHASQNEREQVPGYSANYGGLIVGVDKSISDRWRAGGVFSYTNTAINDEGDAGGDSTRVNSYGFIGYASYTGQPWYVNLSGGVVQQDYTTNRQVAFTGFAGNANGQFSGQQYVARAEAGYPLPLGPATLTPLASLTYSNLHQNGYTESGGNGAALTVGSDHSASVRSALGVKLEEGFATTYGVLVPDIKLQWLHEYDHAQQVTGASFAADPTGETGFTTVGASPVSDVADVSLGVTLLRANNLSLTMRYELQAGGGFVSQTGSLRLRQVF
ncbi:autotransporter domain-containing protein [Burkholderia sp. L27(2015)]|uniref:autotransporter outer membrane beta-barrel domain-containing protein n=1 Tax=Burkholderia sp. L27(2015) TaxID=1641858 RepID=UPI00131B9775|nr:autotransporter domain-containing protein [Burkholderia sp. L27(2015)]